MRRREFLGVLGGVSVLPSAIRAQQSHRLARIGYLAFTSASQHATRIEAFRAGLRDLGYVEGKNIQIEFRFAEGDNDRLRDLAAELVTLKVDAIVTFATGVLVAQHATATIPIVMATYGDAVITGMVGSLAHPGGNVTGSTFFSPELMAKRLELMKEIAPSVSRVGVLLFRGNEQNSYILEVMERMANALKVELQPVEVGSPTDLDGAFSVLAEKKVGALVVGDHAFFVTYATDAVVALAAKIRLPSIGPVELVAKGGLVGYGVNFPDMFRRAAVFVDKILKGANPGEIPIEQASKFETVVNTKAARAIGIEMPTSVLLRANEVIE